MIVFQDNVVGEEDDLIVALHNKLINNQVWNVEMFCFNILLYESSFWRRTFIVQMTHGSYS